VLFARISVDDNSTVLGKLDIDNSRFEPKTVN